MFESNVSLLLKSMKYENECWCCEVKIIDSIFIVSSGDLRTIKNNLKWSQTQLSVKNHQRRLLLNCEIISTIQWPMMWHSLWHEHLANRSRSLVLSHIWSDWVRISILSENVTEQCVMENTNDAVVDVTNQTDTIKTNHKPQDHAQVIKIIVS